MKGGISTLDLCTESSPKSDRDQFNQKSSTEISTAEFRLSSWNWLEIVPLVQKVLCGYDQDSQTGPISSNC